MKFTLQWDAGATAEIDLHEPLEGQTYRLRYNSPYRTTLRSPIEALPVGPRSLERTRRELKRLAESLDLASSRGDGAGGAVAAPDSIQILTEIGRELYDLILPPHVQSDLHEPIYVELAVDESLLALPWELMHDGSNFLGSKHAMGRFINLHTTIRGSAAAPRGPGSDLGDLRVLVVGVPRPTTIGDMEFDELKAVKPEIKAIVETLGDLGIEPTLLLDEDATYSALRDELRNEYHIIHFSGHASFNKQEPNSSALVLHDDMMETGAIMASFSRHPAILCFINGCETTRAAGESGGNGSATDEQAWETRYSNYGLARAFLETGSYLLGSRWQLDDTAAAIFARTFYRELLGNGAPVGKAIVAARTATIEQSEADNYAWASYVYYGDPRITFHPKQAAVADAPAPGAESSDSVALQDRLRDLATDYTERRDQLDPGWDRTGVLTAIVEEASALAQPADVGNFLEELWNESDGGRVIALGVLAAKPSLEYFGLLNMSVAESKSAFEQYMALKVLRPLASQLDQEQAEQLQDSIETLNEDEEFFGTDRFGLASQISMQLIGTGQTEPA